MKLSSLIHISETYFRNKERFKLQIFIVFSLMFFLLFFIIAFSSTFHATIKKIFSSENNTFLTVAPKEMDIAYFKFNTPSFLGKGKLTEKDVEYFNSIQGIKAVSPTYNLDAPAHLSGQLFDVGYGTDLSLFGEERVFAGKWYSKKNTSEARAIVSSKLLDIYNSSFAPANNLPKLTEKVLIGRKFDLQIGSNSFRDGGKTHKLKVTIIGLDNDVPFLGLTLPENTLRQIAESIEAPFAIANIKVYFNTSSDMLKAAEIIKKDGYRILENENDIFRTINRYVSRLDYILFVPVIFILLVIALFVQNQIRYMLLYLKREIGIQMAIGAFDKDIIVIWIYQYAKFIIYGLITGAGISFVILKFLIAANSDSVLGKLMTVEYNFTVFGAVAAGMTVLGVIYVYYKIRYFLKNNSIIGLMSND
jgi:putative ABC transport system permease protein